METVPDSVPGWRLVPARASPSSCAATTARLRTPIASAEPYDDQDYDEEDDGADELESLPVDWDATLAWQRFRLSSTRALQPILEDKTPRFGQVAGSAAGTIFFLFILHYYLLHAGGGLVIVPE